MVPLSGHNPSPALAAWVLLAVHGIGWLLGCAERRTENTVATADSSGVEIRTIHGSPELLSTLGLGEALGEPKVPESSGVPGFSTVPAGVLFSDGSAAVLDGMERAVFIFDPLNRLVSTVGRQGEGPGEFQFPTNLSLFKHGSVAVFDRRNRRFTVMTREGSLESTVSVEGIGSLLGGWVGAEGSGWFILHISGTSEGTPISDGAALREFVFCLRDIESEAEPFCFVGGQELMSGSGSGALPFGGHPGMAPLEQGLMVSKGGGFELIRLNQRLKPESIIRWPEFDHPVSQADIDAVWEELGDVPPELRSSFEMRLSRRVLPEVKPAIGKVVVADDGETWLGLAEPFNRVSREWVVLSPGGMPRGRVVLPPGARVLDIRGSQLLVVRRDALDLPVVERYQRPGFP